MEKGAKVSDLRINQLLNMLSAIVKFITSLLKCTRKTMIIHFMMVKVQYPLVLFDHCLGLVLVFALCS